MSNWREIPHYENYDVSDDGHVRNRKTGRILKTSWTRGDYEKVNLRSNGEAKSIKVHRLVAGAFIPNEENKPYVNHLDGNKHNNRADNLEWCTSSENNKHAFDNGLSYRPDSSGVPKRKTVILETGMIFDSISDCARFLGTSGSHVSACLAGRLRTCCGYHVEYAT